EKYPHPGIGKPASLRAVSGQETPFDQACEQNRHHRIEWCDVVLLLVLRQGTQYKDHATPDQREAIGKRVWLSNMFPIEPQVVTHRGREDGPGEEVEDIRGYVVERAARRPERNRGEPPEVIPQEKRGDIDPSMGQVDQDVPGQ